jgi:hypothetical protein
MGKYNISAKIAYTVHFTKKEVYSFSYSLNANSLKINIPLL